MSERMQRYPRLGGWISIGDWPLRGLDEPGSILPAGCVMITCHPGPAYWSLVEAGRGGLVGTDYFDWGWRGVLLCYSALRSIPLEIPTYHTAVLKIGSANLGEWRHRWEGWFQPGAAASSRHAAE
jgi:hypothetical protein